MTTEESKLLALKKVTEIIIQKKAVEIPRNELLQSIEMQVKKAERLLASNDRMRQYALVMLQVFLYLSNGGIQNATTATMVMADYLESDFSDELFEWQDQISESATHIYTEYQSAFLETVDAEEDSETIISSMSAQALFRITEILISRKAERIDSAELVLAIEEQISVTEKMIRIQDVSAVQAMVILQALLYLKNGSVATAPQAFNAVKSELDLTPYLPKMAFIKQAARNLYQSYHDGLAKIEKAIEQERRKSLEVTLNEVDLARLPRNSLIKDEPVRIPPMNTKTVKEISPVNESPQESGGGCCS